MGVIPMGEHYKSIFLSVIILADKFSFVEALHLCTFRLDNNQRLPNFC